MKNMSNNDGTECIERKHLHITRKYNVRSELNANERLGKKACFYEVRADRLITFVIGFGRHNPIPPQNVSSRKEKMDNWVPCSRTELIIISGANNELYHVTFKFQRREVLITNRFSTAGRSRKLMFKAREDFMMILC